MPYGQFIELTLTIGRQHLRNNAEADALRSTGSEASPGDACRYNSIYSFVFFHCLDLFSDVSVATTYSDWVPMRNFPPQMPNPEET